jgi:hypothetical protein
MFVKGGRLATLFFMFFLDKADAGGLGQIDVACL